jgi:hypothetical protein
VTRQNVTRQGMGTVTRQNVTRQGMGTVTRQNVGAVVQMKALPAVMGSSEQGSGANPLFLSQMEADIPHEA